MKINIKKLGIETEVDAEEVAKKVIDNHEKDWKEKFDTKHNAKKEIMELKHKYKLEEQRKNPQNIDLQLEDKKKIEVLEREKEKNSIEKLKRKSKSRVKIASIILLFVYGMFCIVGFKDSHIISAIISLIQVIFAIISILTSMELCKLFENDYKLFFILSIIMIIPWLAFAV